MGKWKPSDFNTGNEISSPQKNQLWHNVVKRSFGSWECAGKRYKVGGMKALRCQGMSQVLRDLCDPKSLENEARESYGGREGWTIRRMEEKLLKTVAGSKANQFRNNFSTLYNMHSDSAPRFFDESESEEKTQSSARQSFRKKLREGELDEKEIEIKIADAPPGVEIMAPPGLEDMTNQLKSMFSNMNSGRKKSRRMSVRAALKIIKEEEAAKLINDEEIKNQAIEAAEQTGIVFIDEIDKVTNKHDHGNGGVSREGVQRDLLPLIEGSTLSLIHI